MDNLKIKIKNILTEYANKTLVLTDNVMVSESLKYHIDNELSLTNNIYRVYSQAYFNLVNEVLNYRLN